MISSLHLPQTRWGAFLGHLFISVIIFILLVCLIAFVMFPGALFHMAGGIDGIKIVAGVDLVLGPLLTLIVYNRNKPIKELYRDLLVIAFIQIAALGAGMYLVHHSRPAAVTHVFDTFYTSKKHEFIDSEQAAPKGLRWFAPQYYYLDLPEDTDDARTIVATYEIAGEAARLRSDLYLPLEGNPQELRKKLRIESGPESSDTCEKIEMISAFDVVNLCFNLNNRTFDYPP